MKLRLMKIRDSLADSFWFLPALLALLAAGAALGFVGIGPGPATHRKPYFIDCRWPTAATVASHESPETRSLLQAQSARNNGNQSRRAPDALPQTAARPGHLADRHDLQFGQEGLAETASLSHHRGSWTVQTYFSGSMPFFMPPAGVKL